MHSRDPQCMMPTTKQKVFKDLGCELAGKYAGAVKRNMLQQLVKNTAHNANFTLSEAAGAKCTHSFILAWRCCRSSCSCCSQAVHMLSRSRCEFPRITVQLIVLQRSAASAFRCWHTRPLPASRACASLTASTTRPCPCGRCFNISHPFHLHSLLIDAHITHRPADQAHRVSIHDA